MKLLSWEVVPTVFIQDGFRFFFYSADWHEPILRIRIPYYSAYSPDLPGCVATGKTQKQVERNMVDAIQLHLQGLREDNEPIPRSRTHAEYVVLPS